MFIDSTIGRLERRSRNPKMRAQIHSRQRICRCRLQCQINMNLIFHISEDGSEICLDIN